MKKVLFSLFISSILFLVGCQDNSITNPISSDSLSKTDSNNSTIVRGTIVLDKKLANPVIKGNPDFILNGNINYTESIFAKNGPQITGVVSTDAPRFEFKLDISVDASVKIVSSTKVGQNEWKISAASNDKFFMDKNGSTVLIKSYPLLGRTDNMVLVCTFTVTAKGLRLDNVDLNSPVLHSRSSE